MAQFDVHRHLSEAGYLLDCQSDMLAGLSTRLVVPLLPPELAPPPSRRLNPTLRVGDEDVIMLTHFAASVPTRALGEVVGSVSAEYTIIMNALDMLLTGY